VRELALVAGLYFAYDLVHGRVAAEPLRADQDGYRLLHLEAWLHLTPEHWLNNGIEHLPAIAVPACFFYASLHFIVTPAALAWVYRRHPERYRAVRNVLALTTAAALIGFWLYPTAPPRLLPGAGFHDTLVRFRSWGWWGTDASVPAAAAAVANRFAAMPSLHFAWAAWSGANFFRLGRRRWVRALGVAYPLLTALVVVATANHYLADVVAGGALWLVADRWFDGGRRTPSSTSFVGNDPGVAIP
jgi:hypothetical protein